MCCADFVAASAVKNECADWDRKAPVLSGLAHPRHPVHHPIYNHPILELRGCKGAWSTIAKKDLRAPRTVDLGKLAAIPLRSGGAILVCKMVNCKNSPFCRKKRVRRSKIDAFFSNDFDKKVKLSS